jgi:hypothetical protein
VGGPGPFLSSHTCLVHFPALRLDSAPDYHPATDAPAIAKLCCADANAFIVRPQPLHTRSRLIFCDADKKSRLKWDAAFFFFVGFFFLVPRSLN